MVGEYHPNRNVENTKAYPDPYPDQKWNNTNPTDNRANNPTDNPTNDPADHTAADDPCGSSDSRAYPTASCNNPLSIMNMVGGKNTRKSTIVEKVSFAEKICRMSKNMSKSIIIERKRTTTIGILNTECISLFTSSMSCRTTLLGVPTKK